MMDERIREEAPTNVQTFTIFDMGTVPFAPPAEDEMIIMSMTLEGALQILTLKEVPA